MFLYPKIIIIIHISFSNNPESSFKTVFTWYRRLLVPLVFLIFCPTPSGCYIPQIALSEPETIQSNMLACAHQTRTSEWVHPKYYVH